VRNPSPDELAPLSGTERIGFALANWINRYLRGATQLWNRLFGLNIIAICGGRRIRPHGLENIANLNRKHRLVMVANHRSFFDYFVIMSVNLTRANISSRMLFPVRSKFFYTHPIGWVVNLFLSGMTMFPPIMRHSTKRDFNRYALERMIAELRVDGTVLGFHPEGTRNKSPDPYTLLPPKAGIGRLLLEVDDDVTFVPIYVYGISNNLLNEAWRNWTKPNQYPIHVVYGPPIDTTPFHGLEPTKANALVAAQGCLDAIQSTIQRHRIQQEGESSKTSLLH